MIFLFFDLDVMVGWFVSVFVGGDIVSVLIYMLGSFIKEI